MLCIVWHYPTNVFRNSREKSINRQFAWHPTSCGDDHEADWWMMAGWCCHDYSYQSDLVVIVLRHLDCRLDLRHPYRSQKKVCWQQLISHTSNGYLTQDRTRPCTQLRAGNAERMINMMVMQIWRSFFALKTNEHLPGRPIVGSTTGLSCGRQGHQEC